MRTVLGASSNVTVLAAQEWLARHVHDDNAQFDLGEWLMFCALNDGLSRTMFAIDKHKSLLLREGAYLCWERHNIFDCGAPTLVDLQKNPTPRIASAVVAADPLIMMAAWETLGAFLRAAKAIRGEA